MRIPKIILKEINQKEAQGESNHDHIDLLIELRESLDKPQNAVINMQHAPVVQQGLKEAITAVKNACDEAKVSSEGFTIDSCFCDWGSVDTSYVVDAISEAGSQFGAPLTQGYNDVVVYMCNKVTEHFSPGATD